MNFLMGADMMIELSKALPGSIINIGYPAICLSERKACQLITQKLSDIDIETAAVGHAHIDHLPFLESVASCAQNTSVNVWIPCSQRMIHESTNLPETIFLQSCIQAVKLWADSKSIPIDVALVDSTSVERGITEKVLRLSQALLENGCRRIIIADTLGICTSARTRSILNALAKQKIPFEFHGHNDFGKLSANMQAAADCGACGLGTAAFGYGERSTMADPCTVSKEFGITFKNFHYETFSQMHKDYLNRYPKSKSLLNPNTITTGAQLRLRSKEPNKELLFGVTSDRKIAAKMLEIPSDAVSADKLRSIKDEMYDCGICALSVSGLAERF